MTDEEIKQARELVERATPGPWNHADDIRPRLVLYHYDAEAYAERKFNPIGEAYCDVAQNSRANMRFICASRTLVPRLLDEVDRLRAKVSDMRSERLRVDAERDHWRIHAKMMARAADTEKAEREFFRTRCSRLAELAREAVDIAVMSICHLDRDAERKSARLAAIAAEIGESK